MLIAQGGLDNTLRSNRTAFREAKVCGECLSAEGVAVLERIGLLDQLMRLAPSCSRTRRFIHPMGHPFDCGFRTQMLGLSRRPELDGFLLQAARKCGAI